MSAPSDRTYTARPLSGPGPVTMPRELDPRRLVRRAVQIVLALAAIALVVILAPGLGEVRHKLEGAKPGWIALAVALEALSGISYVVMFRRIFCRQMPWRTSAEIGWSELA